MHGNGWDGIGLGWGPASISRSLKHRERHLRGLSQQLTLDDGLAEQQQQRSPFFLFFRFGKKNAKRPDRPTADHCLPVHAQTRQPIDPSPPKAASQPGRQAVCVGGWDRDRDDRIEARLAVSDDDDDERSGFLSSLLPAWQVGGLDQPSSRGRQQAARQRAYAQAALERRVRVASPPPARVC